MVAWKHLAFPEGQVYHIHLVEHAGLHGARQEDLSLHLDGYLGQTGVRLPSSPRNGISSGAAVPALV